MGYTFISYSTKNETFANSINNLFNQNGIRTWMAPHDIPIGSKYAEIITPALKECSCLVLLLSNDAQSSTWVPKEVERAINYKKPVFPIQLEDVVLNAEFEFYISTNQIIVLNKIDEQSEQVKKILETIRACVEKDIPATPPSIIQPADTTSSFPTRRLAVGDVIDGKYLVTSHLFSYRDSDMYITERSKTKEKYFLKVLYKNTDFFNSLRSGTVFLSLRNIASPHLTEIIDFVERDDAIFIVHKYREAPLLRDLLSVQTFSETDLLHIAVQLCDIIDYLHLNFTDSANMFFNITPGNLLLTPDKQVILLDFLYQNQTTLLYEKKTNTLDTIFYTAPETFSPNNSIDVRSDIYSLGATLYSLVTKNDPALPPHAVYPLRSKCPELSLGLEYIINKCMEYDINKRYDNIHSLQRDLKNIDALTKKLTFQKKLHTFTEKFRK